MEAGSLPCARPLGGLLARLEPCNNLLSSTRIVRIESRRWNDLYSSLRGFFTIFGSHETPWCVAGLHTIHIAIGFWESFDSEPIRSR